MRGPWFTEAIAEGFRRFRETFGRAMSATELVETESQLEHERLSIARPRTAGKRDGIERTSTGSLNSSHTVPIFYDKDYVPSDLKNPKRYRAALSSSQSTIHDTTDTHCKPPSNVAVLSFHGSGFDQSYLKDRNLPRENLAEEPQPASGSSTFGSPVMRRQIFLPKLRSAHQPSPKHWGEHRESPRAAPQSSPAYYGSARPSLQPLSPPHQDQSPDLRQKCAQLYSARELFADHLDSALHNLEGARHELESTRKALANKEHDIRDLHIQVRNLKKGMVSSLHPNHPFPILTFSPGSCSPPSLLHGPRTLRPQSLTHLRTVHHP